MTDARNMGHGHVYPRADGAMASCGGPGLCVECARDRIRQLEALVYVPGLWRCPKCRCQVIASNLHAATGQISADNEPQTCPNKCGPMWRVTEREAGNRLIDDADRALPFVKGAYHALRSYEHGNAATDLAKAAADGLKTAFPSLRSEP